MTQAKWFDTYSNWLEHEDIESKIIWLENDYKNLTLSQEIRNDIKKNILDTIQQLHLSKQKAYKWEYQNKAINANWKLKGSYYELAAWIINTISKDKKESIPAQLNQNNLLENNEVLSNIDFSVQNATATIKHMWSSNKDYVLNQRHIPEMNQLWNNLYSLTLVMTRNSKSSLRWDQKITVNFSYDWHRLIFFNDRNNDWKMNNHEWWKLTRIDHKNESKINRNKWTIYHRWNSEIIKLDKNQISENWVKNLILQLYFQ
jgi:hypothetical protein